MDALERIVKMVGGLVREVGVAAVLAIGLTVVMVYYFPLMRETMATFDGSMRLFTKAVENQTDVLKGMNEEFRDHRRATEEAHPRRRRDAEEE